MTWIFSLQSCCCFYSTRENVIAKDKTINNSRVILPENPISSDLILHLPKTRTGLVVFASLYTAAAELLLLFYNNKRQSVTKRTICFLMISSRLHHQLLRLFLNNENAILLIFLLRLLSVPVCLLNGAFMKRSKRYQSAAVDNCCHCI